MCENQVIRTAGLPDNMEIRVVSRAIPVPFGGRVFYCQLGGEER